MHETEIRCDEPALHLIFRKKFNCLLLIRRFASLVEVCARPFGETGKFSSIFRQ